MTTIVRNEGDPVADITRRLGWRHLRGAPTAHIRHHRSGTLVHDGPGLSFWFRSLTAALSEVPVDDRELAMTFHARTADFQDVAVQDPLHRHPGRTLAAGDHELDGRCRDEGGDEALLALRQKQRKLIDSLPLDQ